jgi:hypothetical protein
LDDKLFASAIPGAGDIAAIGQSRIRIGRGQT